MKNEGFEPPRYGVITPKNEGGGFPWKTLFLKQCSCLSFFFNVRMFFFNEIRTFKGHESISRKQRTSRFVSRSVLLNTFIFHLCKVGNHWPTLSWSTRVLET